MVKYLLTGIICVFMLSTDISAMISESVSDEKNEVTREVSPNVIRAYDMSNLIASVALKDDSKRVLKIGEILTFVVIDSTDGNEKADASLIIKNISGDSKKIAKFNDVILKTAGSEDISNIEKSVIDGFLIPRLRSRLIPMVRDIFGE